MLSLPNKTTYMENEELNLEGGIVKITYTDNTTTELNLNSNSLTITGFNNQNIGKQTITVEYQGFTTSFEVEVKEGTKPILSNFSEAKANVTDASVYLYKEIIEDDYIDMNIEISNIMDRDENTEYTYYYYLSENGSEENIENWTELKDYTISKNSDGTYTMKLSINSKDIADLQDLSKTDNLYLYIKEVGTASGESLEQVYTNKMSVDGNNVKYYIDNEYKGGADIVIDSNNPIITPDNNNSGNSGDSTTSPNPIPQTGVVYFGIIALVIISIIAIYFFIRNRNINKNLK